MRPTPPGGGPSRFCAARSPRATTVRGPQQVCARSAARRFTRIWATWIAESLTEGFRPGPWSIVGLPSMAVETRASAYQTAQRRFDAAADVIGLSDDTRRTLREVKRELTVHFPVRMDDGSVHVFTGWRVQHNISRGP